MSSFPILLFLTQTSRTIIPPAVSAESTAAPTTPPTIAGVLSLVEGPPGCEGRGEGRVRAVRVVGVRMSAGAGMLVGIGVRGTVSSTRVVVALTAVCRE